MTEDHCNLLTRALPSCDKMSQSLLLFFIFKVRNFSKYVFGEKKNVFGKKNRKKNPPFLEHIKKGWQIKIIAVIFLIAHENSFKFHLQSQTGAYSCFKLKLSVSSS